MSLTVCTAMSAMYFCKTLQTKSLMTKSPHNLQLQDNRAILAFKSRSDISNYKGKYTDYVTDVHLYDIAVGINYLASSSCKLL